MKVAIIWAALLTLGAPASTAEHPSGGLAPFTARQVHKRVHLLATPEHYHGPAIGNVTIIEQEDGYILVDSGLSAGNGRMIVSYLRTLSAKPVKAVVITHWHNDHPQGVSELRNAWPAVRVIATEQTRRGMLGPEIAPLRDGPVVGLEPDPANAARMGDLLQPRLSALDREIAAPASETARRRAVRTRQEFDGFLAGYPGTYVVPPTETFERRLSIEDDQAPVRVLFLGRANTDGDAIVWLPKQKIVVTGDVVVAPTPFGFFSFPGDWVQTLGAIKALGYQTLIPGHGEPQHDTRYLDQLTGSIEDIRRQVGPLARAGLSLKEVAGRVDYTGQVATFGTNERRQTLLRSYWLDPMTENAWKEARGLPIVQGEGEITVQKQSDRPAGQSKDRQ